MDAERSVGRNEIFLCESVKKSGIGIFCGVIFDGLNKHNEICFRKKFYIRHVRLQACI